MFSSKNCSQLFLTLLHIAVRKLQNKLSWDYYWKQSSFWVATIQSDSQSSLWKTLTEAAIQRCSQTKAFLKYAVNLQENTHAKVAEQLYWNHTLASGWLLLDQLPWKKNYQEFYSHLWNASRPAIFTAVIFFTAKVKSAFRGA